MELSGFSASCESNLEFNGFGSLDPSEYNFFELGGDLTPYPVENWEQSSVNLVGPGSSASSMSDSVSVGNVKNPFPSLKIFADCFQG
jgi:hypothetical protein